MEWRKEPVIKACYEKTKKKKHENKQKYWQTKTPSEEHNKPKIQQHNKINIKQPNKPLRKNTNQIKPKQGA